MKNLKTQLIELLNIHGISGQEKPVRDYLIGELAKLVDKMHVDEEGNLLAEKKVGTGVGATIVLSAHMDTVRNVYKDRKVIEDNGVLFSNKGALGADDRAGIAIILAVLRNVSTTSFSGTIKIAFSVAEEIGCVGASHIDPQFYSDADLAIVVDRRGNRDIVVGCSNAFCSDSVGMFLEDVSKMCDMDWECVEGGVSDAMVFSKNGINSVNLSAGYRNEHSDKEWVSLNDMKDTMMLIMQTLAVINQFYGTFEQVGRENKWIKSYDKYIDNNKYNKYSSVSYYEDTFENNLWIEEEDKNGDFMIYEIGADIVMQQGKNEIILSRQNFINMMTQAQEQMKQQ